MIFLWRKELRGLIPQGFLRRDQGEGLYVSDFPRFPGKEKVEKALMEAGFSLSIQGNAARIDGSREKYISLLRSLPEPCEISLTEENFALHQLGKRLAKQSVPLEAQPLSPILITLKALDEGNLPALLSLLPPILALLQREKKPLPAAAGKLILLALAHQEKGDPLC